MISLKMKKTIIITIIIGVLAYVSHYSLGLFLQRPVELMAFYYAFFALFALLLLWYMKEKLTGKQEKAGYVFMGSVFLKMALFFAAFGWFVYGKEPLSMYQKFQFLVPFFIFLVFEAMVLLKVLGGDNGRIDG